MRRALENRWFSLLQGRTPLPCKEESLGNPTKDICTLGFVSFLDRSVSVPSDEPMLPDEQKTTKPSDATLGRLLFHPRKHVSRVKKDSSFHHLLFRFVRHLFVRWRVAFDVEDVKKKKKWSSLRRSDVPLGSMRSDTSVCEPKKSNVGFERTTRLSQARASNAWLLPRLETRLALPFLEVERVERGSRRYRALAS